MKIKKENLLPKMYRGTVHMQFVRCGKQNCKCRTRGELHGPYYYHFYRFGGRFRKGYIKSEEVEEYIRACLARQQQEKAARAEAREPWILLREINSDMKNLKEKMKKAGII